MPLPSAYEQQQALLNQQHRSGLDLLNVAAAKPYISAADDRACVDDPLLFKRRKAIAYLGDSWILSPNYRFTARHSNDLDAWQLSTDFQQHQRTIADRALADRLSHPLPL